MLECRDGLNLPHEPLGADHRRELRPEHLDRDSAPMLEIFREVDRGHAALAQLALDAVAVGEACPEVLSSHRVAPLIVGPS